MKDGFSTLGKDQNRNWSKQYLNKQFPFLEKKDFSVKNCLIENSTHL